MTTPTRLPLANLPTRIDPMDRLSAQLGGPRLWIKRDDQTGTEISGNKIRKLEYGIQQALDQGCDTLITCGGIQSNHARATAAAAARLGMDCILVLNSDPSPSVQGNYLMDQFFDAEVLIIPPAEAKDRDAIMASVADQLTTQGKKGYILPLGASNGIGALGYVNAMDEIARQEQELGFRFDAIVATVGSGGTYGGLVLGHKRLNHPGIVYGVPIANDAAYFRPVVHGIMAEACQLLEEPLTVEASDLRFLDGYAGRGYALSMPEEIDTIKHVAKTEGIILDPVYTGKAMHGLLKEIQRGTFKDAKNVLFLHTGGLYGVFHFLGGANHPFDL